MSLFGNQNAAGPHKKRTGGLAKKALVGAALVGGAAVAGGVGGRLLAKAVKKGLVKSPGTSVRTVDMTAVNAAVAKNGGKFLKSKLGAVQAAARKAGRI